MDILAFSGGGFDSDGGFDCGRLAEAARFVFDRLEVSEEQKSDLYEGLKVIVAMARSVSAEKMKRKTAKG